MSRIVKSQMQTASAFRVRCPTLLFNLKPKRASKPLKETLSEKYTSLLATFESDFGQAAPAVLVQTF